MQLLKLDADQPFQLQLPRFRPKSLIHVDLSFVVSMETGWAFHRYNDLFEFFGGLQTTLSPFQVLSRLKSCCVFTKVATLCCKIQKNKVEKMKKMKKMKKEMMKKKKMKKKMMKKKKMKKMMKKKKKMKKKKMKKKKMKKKKMKKKKHCQTIRFLNNTNNPLFNS